MTLKSLLLEHPVLETSSAGPEDRLLGGLLETTTALVGLVSDLKVLL